MCCCVQIHTHTASLYFLHLLSPQSSAFPKKVVPAPPNFRPPFKKCEASRIMASALKEIVSCIDLKSTYFCHLKLDRRPGIFISKVWFKGTEFVGLLTGRKILPWDGSPAFSWQQAVSLPWSLAWAGGADSISATLMNWTVYTVKKRLNEICQCLPTVTSLSWASWRPVGRPRGGTCLLRSIYCAAG